MAIRIEPVEDHQEYKVNGKTIYKDTNQNWIARQELSSEETNAFNNYKKSVIDNPAFKKHTHANYGKK